MQGVEIGARRRSKVAMAARDTVSEKEEFVYRISTAEEWEELQKNGSMLGGDLDRTTGCIHLSSLNQVIQTLLFSISSQYLYTP